ncbi:MAG: 1-acyl-sn-glycerol-3-phosphate acyltransferase [Alphaproteobacteria bacterium]|nr:1-acyl-sn-glycerol-3-phosphate acyltransferase [Alphaproteobacteria bacterium]
MITAIRSTLFNILMYGVTAIMCILCLPGLLLPPEKRMGIVRLFVGTVYLLERHVLRLDYEVRGAEHLPASGSYLVAAKHESAYETMKLHIIWPNPSIVLKRELLRIPLWGRYLAMIGPIAIDRSSGKESIAQIIEGALRVKAEGRPMVIFPQGTRVHPDITTTEKPYRIGVARMQEATQLPIIPLALNTGVFWPKHKWRKQSGTVIFEFLPPMPPGNDAKITIAALEQTLESASARLRDEARAKMKK